MAAAPFDLVIRGGLVADGLGGEPRPADLAIQGGRVAAVGAVPGRGRDEIDARGQLVTPGFVDIHTHYDGQAVWDSRLQPSSLQGATTVVMGNCGVGFAPVRPADRERLVELMEGVEDIPGAVLDEGLDWRWESFADFLQVLDGRPHDIDFCAQLPHGALRVYVMGERAVRLEPATDDDMAAMRRLSAEAMRAGALGFSTSRTLNHRSRTGSPTPSLRASEAELTAIAMGLHDAGHGVLEYISDWNTPDVDTEFAMVRRIVRQSGRPLSFSQAQSHLPGDDWRHRMALVEAAARDEGLPIRVQVAPRPIGVLFSLQGSSNPFALTAAWQSIAALPLADKLQAMRDPSLKARMLAEAEALVTRGSQFQNRLGSRFHLMFELGDPPCYEPPHDTSIAARAQRLGVAPASLAYDLLLQGAGRCFLFTPFTNYIDGHLDACGEMLDSPQALLGLGDGGAHVGIICDASFGTHLLTHWGRDRPRGRKPLGRLVQMLTSANARAVGLLDRGVLAPGMKADVNVIDFDRLGITAPEIRHDLPAGGRRLMQGARGYTATIVSGQVVYRDGEPTAALPGRLVRGPQAAPG